ncbi:AMP-binding protein [Streptomyces sp. WMMC500]|uniref:class I adenylate-forming enzyme family protein n=1 Tax=Streptomyces sp. WMMC500 TaxID=3015154 RepID=UPI00248ADF27|nr:AMP-binding protein [Streptomyces sp. WMMC500]WBB61252.1 AMP-binding protein [Streptomyces sp. WMMC500]
MREAPRPWQRWYPASVEGRLPGSFPTLLSAWDEHVRRRPDAPAVHYFDASLSFATVDHTADALACWFRDLGVQRSDRVACYLQNDPQWLVVMLAAWKAGAVPVAVNPMLRHEELAHHLADSGAVVLVCLDHLYGEVAAEVVPRTAVRHVLTTHPVDMTPGVRIPGAVARHVPDRSTFGTTTGWREVVARYGGRRPEAAVPRPDDVAMLTYTSGTTGRAKGAMNLHSAMVHSSTVYGTWWDLRPGRDVVLCVAPVFHITGAVAGLGAAIVAGVPVVLLHRFDPEVVLRAVDRWRPTFTVAASTAFIALVSHPSLPRYDVTSLAKTLSGGAPVSAALVRRVRDATGWTLHGVYGMTETTSPTHLAPPGVPPPVDPESGALSVGIPVPGCAVRIVDPVDGRALPPGEAGEIVVSGPMVVPGYWRLPDESARAVREGWLHTGDIGKETEEGWLFVVDRLKDLINAGGYKIFPRDVEDVLHRHPAVREAAVVGVPDEYRGETVKAFVSLVPGHRVDPGELIAHCKERMAAYKYPRDVEILDELPKNAGGKVLRRELRGR